MNLEEQRDYLIQEIKKIDFIDKKQKDYFANLIFKMNVVDLRRLLKNLASPPEINFYDLEKAVSKLRRANRSLAQKLDKILLEVRKSLQKHVDERKMEKIKKSFELL